ncbi:cytidylate kinase [Micromonospora craterilacus]|uniref:Cytidylate kinase n=1 Tax=Micromonospora craterilacus TaxID=1655439 RepID=A0A2W2DTB4_9ACTN|nr:cytidylate kinase-like family protein [Micromonospora craterilacus]PZG15242.1 cytidylate kinase [Micromonospora craterilacus]
MARVILSGLTAAGKTTHAALLAKHLGHESIHITDLLLSELGGGFGSSEGVWFHRMAEIESLRDGGDVDDRVDRILSDVVRNRDGVVVDAWALPWYFTEPAIRIWIGSDRLSRSWKCAVSSPAEVALGPTGCAKLVDEKDRLTRQRFLRRYDFDIFSDRDVFDFVLDNSHLIDAPTRASADVGIDKFHRVLVACVEAGSSGDPGPLRALVNNADPDLRSSVVRVGGPCGARWRGRDQDHCRPVVPSRAI